MWLFFLLFVLPPIILLYYIAFGSLHELERRSPWGKSYSGRRR